MNREILILLFSWLISILLLIKYIPIERKRNAHITFLFVQALAWIYEYIQLLLGVMDFPFREFVKATKMSFSLYYLIFPIFGVFFIMLFPGNKKNSRIIIHYLLFAISITTYSFLVERYSSLFDWKSWNVYISFVSNLAILYIIKKFVFWFQKGLA
ncbi:CBO0543 family protein [Mesobacillus subterraneus]|uniref:Uncharacterized protein n=1 Tax=Mesobacillus subterraneus TaxID=285983 RepID=A0A3R9F2L3_9BACI|nr:CBO0543 family protein [Mesobacillus subterraneus]RSD28512.1 hypothetical protein EJA10_05370 [Mesobacillus subterraneus]